MKWYRRIMDNLVAWLFALLTFLASVSMLYTLCYEFWNNNEVFRTWDTALFPSFLFALNSFFVWKTGKWVMFKPEEIDGLCMFFIWVGLIFILFIGFVLLLPSGWVR